MDGRGRVFVVEGRFDRVQAYDPEGQMILYFGNSGNGEGEFFLPTGIAVDSEGKLYVADSQNGRVEIFRLKAAGEGGH